MCVDGDGSLPATASNTEAWRLRQMPTTLPSDSSESLSGAFGERAPTASWLFRGWGIIFARW